MSGIRSARQRAGGRAGFAGRGRPEGDIQQHYRDQQRPQDLDRSPSHEPEIMQACGHDRRYARVQLLSESREDAAKGAWQLSQESEIPTFLGRYHPARNLDDLARKCWSET